MSTSFPVFGSSGFENQLSAPSQALPRDPAREQELADAAAERVLQALNPKLYAARELLRRKEEQVRNWQMRCDEVGRLLTAAETRCNHVLAGAIAGQGDPFTERSQHSGELEQAREELSAAEEELSEAREQHKTLAFTAAGIEVTDEKHSEL